MFSFQKSQMMNIFLGVLLATALVIDAIILGQLENIDLVIVFWITQFLFIALGVYIYQYRRQMLVKAEHAERENLRLLEKRLAALEAAAEGIAIVDDQGILTYMNASLMQLHGIPECKENDYTGHHWTKLYAQKGADDIDQYVLPALERDGYWRGEISQPCGDGDVVMLDVSFSKAEDGGIISTTRDISAQRRANQEKEDMEEQFYQAQKMEAIGRLAGGIAHDFNNILAAMNGYAEFLSEDLSPQTQQHEFAMKILAAGRQAKDLVDQLLAFSRQKQSAKEGVDLVVPVQETLSIISSSLPKTVNVHFHSTLEHAPIDGNETQISQVLMNLGVNAADALNDEKGDLEISLDKISPMDIGQDNFIADSLPQTEEAPPILIEDLDDGATRLQLSTLAKDHDYVRLRVKDSGEGISRVIMEHIFEPFFTTKDVNKGTGLGLATVHGVIVSHQGAMIVESLVGQGTCFDLFFPLIGDFVMREAVHDKTEERQQTAQHAVRILIVEDEKHVRDMMVHSVERLGYHAEGCVNGLEGLASLKENPDGFDVVITDHNMPKMSGLEMIMQAQLVAPDMPFIVVSGYSKEKLHDIMKDMPAVKGALRKPVSHKILGQKIRDVLEERVQVV